MDLGEACEKFHDEHVRNVRVRRSRRGVWSRCRLRSTAKNLRRSRRERYALLSCDMHRLRNETSKRRSRPQARKHELCGAAQFDDAYGDEEIYTLDERFQQENSEPHCYGGDPRGLLQFCTHPQNAKNHAKHGRWFERSCLDAGRDRDDGRQLYATTRQAWAVQKENGGASWLKNR